MVILGGDWVSGAKMGGTDQVYGANVHVDACVLRILKGIHYRADWGIALGRCLSRDVAASMMRRSPLRAVDCDVHRQTQIMVLVQGEM